MFVIWKWMLRNVIILYYPIIFYGHVWCLLSYLGSYEYPISCNITCNIFQGRHINITININNEKEWWIRNPLLFLVSLSLLSNGSNKCEKAFVKYTASDSSVKNLSNHICTHRCSIYQTCNSWTDVHIFKFWPTADPNTISPGIQYYEWQQGYGDQQWQVMVSTIG